MSLKQSKPKSKIPKNVKIKSKKDKSLEVGGAVPDDVIEKEDFDSEEDKEEEDDETVEEEQKEEDDDLLAHGDYGDEDLKDVVEEEVEGDYDQGDGDCLYKFSKKAMSDEEGSDIGDDLESVFEDDIATEKHDQIVKNEDRETKPVITKYERVRILGDRAKQLSSGAKPMLLNVENMSPKEIAKLELERGVIPFWIEKVLPNGRRERWKINELKIVN